MWWRQNDTPLNQSEGHIDLLGGVEYVKDSYFPPDHKINLR
jgi:hypothetical protein